MLESFGYLFQIRALCCMGPIRCACCLTLTSPCLTMCLTVLLWAQDLEVFESTLVSLQALADVLGEGSDELTAATHALLAQLKAVKEQLQQLYGDDVLYHVSVPGDAPVASNQPMHLMDWKEMNRRVLLTQRAVAADDPASGKGFATKAAGYGTGLLLLYFTFASIYCMCTMKFKQDTLLYGRSKAD